MAGLAKICKMYGSVKVTGADGKEVIWLWDYAQDKPRLKSEMTAEEIKESEIAKWLAVKTSLENEKKNNEK